MTRRARKSASRISWLMGIVLLAALGAPVAALAADLSGVTPAIVLAQFELPTVFAENGVLVAVIIGFFMPAAIEAINRRTWPSELKAASAFVLCIPGSLLAVYVAGQWNTATFDEWLRTFLIIFFVAIAMHRWYWKPSGISDAIAKATG